MFKDTNNTVEKLAIRLASLEADEKKKTGNSGAANDSLSGTQGDPWASSRWGAGGPTALVGSPAPSAKQTLPDARLRPTSEFSRSTCVSRAGAATARRAPASRKQMLSPCPVAPKVYFFRGGIITSIF